MPYRDTAKAKASAAERKRRYRQRRHDERYGVGAPDQRGRQNKHVRGEQHYRWNSSRLVTSQGYILVRVPKDHPMHIANGYTYEHRLVASEMLGRTLDSNEIVHHKNGDKADNRPENLEVMRRNDHNRLHLIEDERRDTRTGRLIGKKLAGRELDGRTWDEYPEVQP